MHRRRLLALALSLAAAPAWAAEGGAPKAIGQYVDLQPVALPVMINGQLENYVFVYVRLVLAGGADTARWRLKEPFFRDALVRAAHRTPFNPPGVRDKIDPARLSEAMMRAATAIAGAGVVRSVVITSQAPRGQAPPPKG